MGSVCPETVPTFEPLEGGDPTLADQGPFSWVWRCDLGVAPPQLLLGSSHYAKHYFLCVRASVCLCVRVCVCVSVCVHMRRV